MTGRWARLTIVVGIGGVVLLACTPFDAGATGTPDAAAAPPNHADDAGDAGDAGGSTDAAESSPCTEQVVLLGSDDVATDDSNDYVPDNAVDAYRYEATPEAARRTARCAWVYAVETHELSSGTVHLGVYTDEKDVPRSLLRRVTFQGVKVGWNSVALDPPLSLAPGERLWLALTADAGQFRIRAPQMCREGQSARQTHPLAAVSERGLLPTVFSANGGGPECGAAMHLGP